MNDRDEIEQDATSRRIKQAFIVFAVIGAFFVVAEHRAHLIPYLPWLFLAACPLMHLFMRHGHGGHGRHRSNDQPARRSNDPPVNAGEPPLPPRHLHGEQS